VTNFIEELYIKAKFCKQNFKLRNQIALL